MIHVEESDYEKLRRKNIEKNTEEFNKLFPVGIMKLATPRTVATKRRRKDGTPKFKILDLTPRSRLSRACKRKKHFKDGGLQSKKFCFSDDTYESTDEEINENRICVKFTSWTKFHKKHQNKMPISGEFMKDFEDTFSDSEMDEEARKVYACMKSPRRRVTLIHRPFDAVKEEDLVLVAERTSDKRYDSEEGTSCHQCRQKTDDLKTVCRSDNCFGVRGQFCGPCLKNRYGECAKEAIMNPDWECPPCQGICNCSFCMKKRGRRATGILIHVAKQKGYTDVKSFLGD